MPFIAPGTELCGLQGLFPLFVQSVPLQQSRRGRRGSEKDRTSPGSHGTMEQVVPQSNQHPRLRPYTTTLPTFLPPAPLLPPWPNRGLWTLLSLSGCLARHRSWPQLSTEKAGGWTGRWPRSPGRRLGQTQVFPFTINFLINLRTALSSLLPPEQLKPTKRGHGLGGRGR